MRLPNSGRASNQRRCSRSAATLPMMTIDDPRRGSPAMRRASSPSVPVMVRCDGSEPSWTSRRRFGVGASAVEHRLQDRRHLPRAGVADDRAAQVGQGHPVDLGRRLAAVLEALDEGHRLARAGIGHGHAGIGRHRDAGRQAGHDLEGDALLVQEDRFLAAAVEEERIAPLEADDDLALAGLLGDEQADRVLLAGLRGGGADVDALRVRRRHRQQARVDEVIVDHHVRALEAAQAAHGDERGVAGAGADQVDGGHRASGYCKSVPIREPAAPPGGGSGAARAGSWPRRGPRRRPATGTR